MSRNQTIAIIGATSPEGQAIAGNLSGGHCRLILMSEEQEKLARLIDDLTRQGAVADLASNPCQKEASWEADIIVIATSCESEREVAARIRPYATRKIVISVSHSEAGNYERADSDALSAAEELQKLLPHSSVVKALNTACIPVAHGDGRRGDTFIAGNNDDAVRTVFELMQSAGLNPLVAGDLSVSRTLETLQVRLKRMEMQYRYDHPAQESEANPVLCPVN